MNFLIGFLFGFILSDIIFPIFAFPFKLVYWIIKYSFKSLAYVVSRI